MKIITVESFTGATYGEERTFRIDSEQKALAKAFGGKQDDWKPASLDKGATHRTIVRGYPPVFWKRE